MAAAAAAVQQQRCVVRVLYDYTYRVMGGKCRHLWQGDECLVLCDYDQHWLYVCKLADTTYHMYVPRQYVEPVGATSSGDDDQQLYVPMRRERSASPLTAATGAGRVMTDGVPVSVVSDAASSYCDRDDSTSDYVLFQPTDCQPPPASSTSSTSSSSSSSAAAAAAAAVGGSAGLDYCNTAASRASTLQSAAVVKRRPKASQCVAFALPQASTDGALHHHQLLVLY